METEDIGSTFDAAGGYAPDKPAARDEIDDEWYECGEDGRGHIDIVGSLTLRRNHDIVQLHRHGNIPIRTYDAEDTESVLKEILAGFKGRIVLVVGHSDTLPELIANVGASKRVPPIEEDEYGNLYIVSIPWFGKTKTIRVRYGEPYRAPTDEAYDAED
jgi:hypothetical protein